MYLSTVEIKNFRCLQDMTVHFRPGLNVVVGRNNTGKTHLLRAIRHALGPSASRGEYLWLERDDFYKVSPDDETERTISVVLTFEDLTEEQQTNFFDIVDFDLGNLANSKAIVRFEASWPKGKKQATIKRTGGTANADSPEIPAKILEQLPITFLPALRDAEAALAPGARSRLAKLLEDLAGRSGKESESQIEAIFDTANRQLEGHPLIDKVRGSLQSTTGDLAGSDYRASAIKTSEVKFARILRSLQVQMEGVPIGGLDANGLGYNNLLYIAVVLEHLSATDSDEFPLLLVEEPEAHLHPQLTVILGQYLSDKKFPQTILTTHSPTLAASVSPERIHTMFAVAAGDPQCNSIGSAGMEEPELKSLQRMMDVTRASMYFAKGIILVEGMSEALLIPVLAKRLGHDLSKLHISVIPICGVAFETFKKLLDRSALAIPTAIVSDADPPIDRDGTWRQDQPVRDGTAFKLSDRAAKLRDVFAGHEVVDVSISELTLEYDLAAAGEENAAIMTSVWEECFTRKPGTLNAEILEAAGEVTADRAITVWRGICRAEHTGSKAELSHRLAQRLDLRDPDGRFRDAFAVPEYLKRAINFVVEKVEPVPQVAEEILNRPEVEVGATDARANR